MLHVTRRGQKHMKAIMSGSCFDALFFFRYEDLVAHPRYRVSGSVVDEVNGKRREREGGVASSGQRAAPVSAPAST